MKKFLVLSAVATLVTAAGGCNCCDFTNCFRRSTTAAAVPVYSCPPVATSVAAPIAAPITVEPSCGSASFAPAMPGPVYTQ